MAQTVAADTFLFPTSFAQRRLWFLSQLEPGSPFYNMPLAVSLLGTLDRAALGRALDELVARHEALRTTFRLVDGDPMQVVNPSEGIWLPEVDLADLPGDERDAEVRRLVDEEARRPFDMAADPPLRARLLRLGTQERVLVLVVHHIVSDGWSMSVLFRELGALYRAFAAGEPSPLAPLPVQYADFTVWQRDRLQGETLERQLAYWKTRLSGAPAVLELPADRPRTAARSFRGAKESALFPLRLLNDLRAVGQREGATLFMTLLAGFQTLLGRYTGREDIVVGSPIAGRTRPELEGLIGFFVNSLAMRTDLSGDLSFRQLLRRVRETTLGAFAHQELPFERLVEELGPERLQDRNPVFQVMFTLQNTPRAALELPGLALHHVPTDTGTAKFDLTLYTQEQANGLGVTVEYSTDLFEASTIVRLIGHLETLLEAIVADPDRQIHALPLAGPAERHQLLDEWNATRAEYPREATIQELFERQAARTPGGTAVVHGRETLTYRELNRRANRLARRLRRSGVGPDVRVGIALERSPNLVAGVLAVLKAGGAYVPLDPSYPPDRLAFMLADAEIGVLVTQTRLLGTFPVGKTEVICVDREQDRAEIAGESDEDPEPGAGPLHLAYVIYTSGSTGQPKGVAVPHRSVIRLVCNTDYVRLTPAEVVVQVSNASFDAATFELWGALLHGAGLVIIDRDVTLSPPDFAAALRDHQITAMFLTTALFNEVAGSAPDAFATLRHLLVGGEVADPRRMRGLLKGKPPERLLNVYGPTETTTFASWHLVSDVPEDSTGIPIGRPVANTQLWVVDRRLEVVPVGVTGELFIGGPGV
ncbi:MAG: AMP-binding protein, partial [Gemmatimonadales bacterium]|nr:AMP-binding protein [Gemmatimonadales bacterium]